MLSIPAKSGTPPGSMTAAWYVNGYFLVRPPASGELGNPQPAGFCEASMTYFQLTMSKCTPLRLPRIERFSYLYAAEEEEDDEEEGAARSKKKKKQ